MMAISLIPSPAAEDSVVEASLAQSVERKALNLVVVGSCPTVGVWAHRKHESAREVR